MKMDIYNPVSTYRLQFHSGFTLNDAGKIRSYLHKLGIKSIYASPVFQAVKGSMHGYDVTDPLKLNTEIGDEKSFTRLVNDLHGMNMGWIQDFVPNHMAYSPENPWINDILMRGRNSLFYEFFDIISDHPDERLQNRLMLPFFGKEMAEIIEEKELILAFDEKGFKIKYFENEFPVSVNLYTFILNSGPVVEMPQKIKIFLEKNNLAEKEINQLFSSFTHKDSESAYLSACTSEINKNPGRMRELVGKLSYLPVYWKETEKRINYRRFFTINDLICLNIQNENLFPMYHQYLKSLIEKKLINGLRIDHIDGLADPGGYLESLRVLTGEELHILVEKILEEDEKLPGEWPVQGTTGYDFLAMVNNLLTNEDHGSEMYSYYRNWNEHPQESEELMYNKKRFILFNRLKGELDILYHQFSQMELFPGYLSGKGDYKNAIADFMIYCPVYKIYNPPSEFTQDDKKMIHKIFERAVRYNPDNEEVFSEIKSVFLLSSVDSNEIRDKIDNFFRRMMQFTGPLMAKGVEDTAFYSYNPFIAYNEVGDNPSYFGITTEKFHSLMIERQESNPLTMNTTATHDTKRGEDARARMNVLSDIPERWKEITQHWKSINKELKEEAEGLPVPTVNDEYFIYQVLCSHLPMNTKIDEHFIQRLNDYLIKAFREGKMNTSWSEPNPEYEKKTLVFIRRILSAENEFRKSLISFMGEIIPHGIINSLVQVILKNSVPGIPDTFQGSEVWNLSFVDPDNRQPVDYQNLEKSLDLLISEQRTDASALGESLWQNRVDGIVKQWVTHLTLRERIEYPDLFLNGRYIPLKVEGKNNRHIISFLRHYRNNYLLVTLPLNTATLNDEDPWEETYILLPDIAPPKWLNILNNTTLEGDSRLKVSEIFGEIPLGICRGIIPGPERKAGILLHISSLPGQYGIGDFGKEAKNFIDFLYRTGQQYWQVLPLSQSDHLTGYSPYSSYSAFAGNTLFIHPESLWENGLLNREDMEKYSLKNGNQVDYGNAEKAKNYFLDEAFSSYKISSNKHLKRKFEQFQKKENYWLNDFALFLTLKKHFDFIPWNEWPANFRNREIATLVRFDREHKKEIEMIMFKQFIFSDQWKEIKNYARSRGITLFGDMPIYIDYDSADVWANPDLFHLNDDMTMSAVAGVPPDYFNENGQLWGMPLFNWKEMKNRGYQWWTHRIRKNLEWFDLLRLDHFRGFSAYWQVPASEEVAINGKWVKGPGEDLFDVIQREFPDMPFVAEDLGQIDQDVYDLRDHYGLPGMRVLQFGFEQDMPWSQHSLLNYTRNSIAYTGTHDNNTIKGWYRKEADKELRKRFKAYTGKKLKEKKCHLDLIRLTYSSAAALAIIPMQDWLGLDEKSRMNFPSTTEGNWLWKLQGDEFTRKLEKKINKMVKTFGRMG